MLDPEDMSTQRKSEVEGILFHGVEHGSFAGYEKWLKALRDVDTRSHGRTLLHEAIRGGRLDWVEGLLARGSDPALVDDGDRSGATLAEQMCAEHPGSGDRQVILRMVRMTAGRDVVRCGEAVGRADSNPLLPESACKTLLEQLLSSVSLSSLETSSLKDVMTQHMSAVSSESSLLKEMIESLSSQSSLQSSNLSRVKVELESLSRAVNLDRGTPVVGTEGGPERCGVLSNLEHSIETLKREHLELKSALGEVALKIESGFLASRDRSVVTEASTDVQEVVGEGEGSEEGVNAEDELEVGSKREEELRLKCLDNMLSKTEILNKDDEKVSRMRRFYDALYSLSPHTSCLMTFLQGQSRVRVLVDFDSTRIERLKGRVRDHDGVEKNGRNFRTFADFEGATVYLAGKVDGVNKEDYVIGALSMSLAQMLAYLAFENGGRPYAVEDEINGQRYREILEGEEEKKRELGGGGVDLVWHFALTRKTQLAREIYLLAIVPGIVVNYGATRGLSLLRQHLTSLLDYYEKHVMVTLYNKHSV